MKKLVFSLILLSSISCTKEPVNESVNNPSAIQPDTCADYVAFGTFPNDRVTFNVGRHDYFKLCSSGLYQDTTKGGSYFHNPFFNPFSKYVLLDSIN